MDRKKAWATVPMARARKKRSHHARTAPPMGKPGAIQPRMARGAYGQADQEAVHDDPLHHDQEGQGAHHQEHHAGLGRVGLRAKRRKPPTSPRPRR